MYINKNIIHSWKQKFKRKPTACPLFSFDQLNREQKFIIEQVRIQNEKSDEEFFSNPLRLVVAGVAGSGKSSIIEHLQFIFEEATNNNENNKSGFPNFIICAPTGVASFQVSGQTIHHAFHIARFGNSSTRRTAGYKEQQQQHYYIPTRDQIPVHVREEMRHIHWIIIEEFGLVGLALMNYMDYFMRNAVGGSFQNFPFANRSVVCLGDIHQLSPVKDVPLFKPLKKISNADLKLTAELYRSFDAVVMSNVSLRQIGDSGEQRAFRLLLQHLSHAEVTDFDFELICSRLHKNLTVDERIHIEKVGIAVFQTNAQTKLYNRKMLNRNCKDIITIANSLFDDDPLELGIGAPILLNRNLSLELGLVNGSYGYVVDLIGDGYDSTNAQNKKDERAHETKVQCILVHFPEYAGTEFIETSKGRGVPIFRITEPYEHKIGDKYPIIERFPLVLAWSLTIHKVQGLTLNKIIITLGQEQMCCGIDYVAFSRVKSLNDIMIMDENVSIERFQGKTYHGLQYRIQEEQRLNELYNKQKNNVM